MLDVGCSMFASLRARRRTSNTEHPTPNVESGAPAPHPRAPPRVRGRGSASMISDKRITLSMAHRGERVGHLLRHVPLELFPQHPAVNDDVAAEHAEAAGEP